MSDPHPDGLKDFQGGPVQLLHLLLGEKSVIWNTPRFESAVHKTSLGYNTRCYRRPLICLRFYPAFRFSIRARQRAIYIGNSSPIHRLHQIIQIVCPCLHAVAAYRTCLPLQFLRSLSPFLKSFILSDLDYDSK
jgi:hypothetical protein